MELLRKIGIPATLAAVISSLTVSIPLLFKIDERYAKDERLTEEIKKLEQRNADLQKELAQLVGFQQAMLVILQDRMKTVPVERPRALIMPSPPVAAVPELTPVPAPTPAPVVPVPSVGEKATPKAEVKPPPPAPVNIKPDLSKQPIEKPKNLKELSEGLTRQQQRLIKD